MEIAQPFNTFILFFSSCLLFGTLIVWCSKSFGRIFSIKCSAKTACCARIQVCAHHVTMEVSRLRARREHRLRRRIAIQLLHRQEFRRTLPTGSRSTPHDNREPTIALTAFSRQCQQCYYYTMRQPVCLCVLLI